MKTQISSVQRRTNTLWSVTFETVDYTTGKARLLSSVESAPLYVSMGEAYKAGNRAISTLELTGHFPNLKDRF